MTENIGSPVKPQVPEQHRGTPMYTKEEMRRRFPPIRVRGSLRADERGALPHDFKNTVNTADDKARCDLCGKRRLENELHRF